MHAARCVRRSRFGATPRRSKLLRRLRTPGSVRDDEEVAALQHATGTSSLHVDALALYAKGRYLWRARTCASLERALVARFELVRILVGLGRYDAALSHLDVLLTMEARAT